jgi:hypothetical protein
VTHRKAIIALAAQHHLPAVYSFPFFTADGGLMSYGVDLADRSLFLQDVVEMDIAMTLRAQLRTVMAQ